MKTYVKYLVLISAVIAFGCATVPYQSPLNMDEVQPAMNEKIDLDQIMILVDASGSMRSEELFPLEKALVESFAAGMPDGNYNSGMVSFGQNDTSKWLILPLRKFDRTRMTTNAAATKFLAGSTPFDVALQKIDQNFTGRSGKAALVIFSDGEVTVRNAAIDACSEMVQGYRGDICIHAVLMGDNPEGEAFLKELVNMTDCGSIRNGEDINSKGAMEDFIREVFFAQSMEPDTDGDGVPDSRDKCPGTPKGVKVDEDGCPLDTDGDGVYDYMDECPGTPKGAKVDKRGCWTLENLHFDYDKYEIKKVDYRQLDEAVVVLKKNPGLKICIDGHTDFRGSNEYNQTLSENRAGAVKSYFMQQGISADRLKAKGYGETKPVKPNDSEENMALNRRVELTVID